MSDKIIAALVTIETLEKHCASITVASTESKSSEPSDEARLDPMDDALADALLANLELEED